MIVNLDSERDKRIDEAWAEYAAAAQKAQRTLDINDGLAAGRAWKRFLHLFAPIPGGPGPVVPMRRGARR
jgi:hypothetical protein